MEPLHHFATGPRWCQVGRHALTPEEPVVYISPFLTELAHTYGESQSADRPVAPKNALRGGRVGTTYGKDMTFTPGNQARFERILDHYPAEHRRAALLPTLWLVQEQEGYLSPSAMEYVAGLLEISPVHVLETASYYDMFRLQPPGRHDLRLCTNLSCSLLGAPRILDWLRERLGIEPGETTADGRLSLTPAQCLGACERAPMMQLNDRVEGHLSEEKLAVILSELS